MYSKNLYNRPSSVHQLVDFAGVCIYMCIYIYIIHMKHDVALENDDITQAHPTDSFWFMCDDLIHSALTGLHGGPVW